MPHVVISYSINLEPRLDMSALCQEIASTLVAQRGCDGKAVFPIGGTRVFAYPAQHCAVADNSGDYGFCYINIRIAAGRTDEMKKKAGDAVLALAQKHFANAFEKSLVGVTVQIDEAPGQVYDAKHSNLHPLFNP